MSIVSCGRLVSVRPAVIDSNVIWGHSLSSPRGLQDYKIRMSSLKLFYAEPCEIEIAKLCRKEKRLVLAVMM